MTRFPIRELEEAIRDPNSYRDKLLQPQQPVNFGGPSYFTSLRDALYKFHKENSISEAGLYLINRLNRFKNQSQRNDTLNKYSWYVDSYTKSGLLCADFHVRINYKPSFCGNPDLELFGEINRVDVDISGGYIAWFFRNEVPNNWQNEIRMPLTQMALADSLKVKLEEVKVGVIDFESKNFLCYHYSNSDIIISQDRLTKLFKELGV